ncbi:MAG TPA: FAD:protein FMN transferase [Acidimicrobiales bacterium]|nr:FAD:protein FMN transferase [Acidimicrobiales bacterium]
MPNRVLHVMGMAVSIDIRADPPDLGTLEGAVARVGEWLEWVDGVFSTYKDGSDVSRIDRGELDVAGAAPEVAEVLALGERFRAATAGYFDVRAAGRLDPSGVVKGWAVERASALLAEAGFADHAVNAGGDIRARGRPEPGRRWRVGIAHPHVQGGLVAVAEVHEGAVATSGTAERGAHVVDPHTGRAALELASVTVVGAELVSTDVFATAALAMGAGAPAWLAGLEGYEAFVVGADMGTWQTPGFPLAP